MDVNTEFIKSSEFDWKKIFKKYEAEILEIKVLKAKVQEAKIQEAKVQDSEIWEAEIRKSTNKRNEKDFRD